MWAGLAGKRHGSPREAAVAVRGFRPSPPGCTESKSESGPAPRAARISVPVPLGGSVRCHDFRTRSRPALPAAMAADRPYHGGMGRGDLVKLGHRFGVAAGEQAAPVTGTRRISKASPRNTRRHLGRSLSHRRKSLKARSGKCVAESATPGLGAGPPAEVEITDDDERRSVHRRTTRSRFSRVWAATAPVRQRVR
jgi:hypothetical protein